MARLKAPVTSKNGVWQKILDLLYKNLNHVVSNDKIIEVTEQHNYARRIRELRAEGWQIQYSVKPAGYTLLSVQKLKKNPGEYVNLRLRTEVFERDNFTCQMCGYSASQIYADGEKVKLEADHIIPLAEGGKTEVDNLQTLCARCNAGKKSKIAYSEVNNDEVSLVVRLPRNLFEKVQSDAKKLNMTVKERIVTSLEES